MQLRSPCDWCYVSLFVVLIIMSIIWKQGHFWLQILLCWPFTLHVSLIDPRLSHLPNCDLWFPQFIIQTMLNINWLLRYSPTPNNRWYTLFFLWRWEFGQPLRSLLDVTEELWNAQAQKVQIQNLPPTACWQHGRHSFSITDNLTGGFLTRSMRYRIKKTCSNGPRQIALLWSSC